MAGLYIHIPFCAKRCLYCDFFSHTDQGAKAPYIDALIREMALTKTYLSGEPIHTIYFGGGTPSQLEAADFDRLFTAIHQHFDTSHCTEITLEANPDDLSPAYVRSLRALPFNRISMGVQSFDAADLQFLHRRHTREQAIEAVRLCKEHGFSNISIDLIYGLPGQTPEKWQQNLEETLRLDIPHLSAYHLIYEEGTPLYKLMKSGSVSPVDEDVSVALFAQLIDQLAAAGYLHYEISNFARPEYISQHNSSYWSGKKYLGLGASAHSYNGSERRWNVSSLSRYLKGITEGIPCVEIEKPEQYTLYNDYIITRLRTMWGIDSNEIRSLFGEELSDYFLKQINLYVKKGLIAQQKEHFSLTKEGIFVSDGIMSALLKI